MNANYANDAFIAERGYNFFAHSFDMRAVGVCACLIFLSLSCVVQSQEKVTENIVVVTLDGVGWQEVFLGANPDVLFNSRYVTDTAVWRQFGAEDETVSRRKLMPFFWDVLAMQGQLYGNREFNNKVDCENRRHLSFPGYSEMLVGFHNPVVSSNDLIANPDPTVLEFINQQPGFEGKVAAFATWDAFPYILREGVSGIMINAAYDNVEGDISEIERRLNEQQHEGAAPRDDIFTFRFGLEYMKRMRPRVTLIALNETDEHAHNGSYDGYLKALHASDRYISELWDWIQQDSLYRDKTTLLITTDHGRGTGRHSWQNHRMLSPGSGHIWFAVIGPDTPAFGEMKASEKYTQSQIAKTIASFLGLDYAVEAAAEPVYKMFTFPQTPDQDVLVDRDIDDQRK